MLIDERVLVTNARESGAQIDEAELDRAVANVAAQNQLTVPQLRERLRKEGIDYAKFRSNIKDQMMVERMREREVASRIRVSDAEIDALIEERRSGGANAQFNIAQIMVPVPDNATQAVVAERRARGAGGAAPGSRRRGLRGGGPRGVAGRQSRRGRRDRHAAGRPPARRLRQGGPAAEVRARSRPTCCAAPPAFTCSS